MANKAGELHRVEGSNETRRSPRVYTHAVVADFDRARALESAIRSALRGGDGEYSYHVAVSKATPGVPVKMKSGQPGRPDYEFTYSEKDVQQAQEHVGGLDRAGFVAKLKAQCAARIDAGIADGTLQVLQWSQSERSAVKAIGSLAKRCSVRNVRVVPVKRGK